MVKYISGADPIRRVEGALAWPYLTLLTNSEGKKTKTNQVPLGLIRRSLLDFYQYWRNIDDRDVKMSSPSYILTMEEVKTSTWKALEINRLKRCWPLSSPKPYTEEEAQKAQDSLIFASGTDPPCPIYYYHSRRIWWQYEYCGHPSAYRSCISKVRETADKTRRNISDENR